MSNDVELFRIESEEYDPFEGKSLDMLKHLINNCEGLYFYKDCEDQINLVFTQKDKNDSVN